MEIIDNINKTLRDDLKVEIKEGSKLSIAAAYFSIYAFQELKEELRDITLSMRGSSNQRVINLKNKEFYDII